MHSLPFDLHSMNSSKMLQENFWIATKFTLFQELPDCSGGGVWGFFLLQVKLLENWRRDYAHLAESDWEGQTNQAMKKTIVLI